MIALALLLAVLLDALLGEPRRAHPLVVFGHVVHWVECHVYGDGLMRGALAWSLCVLPPFAVLVAVVWSSPVWVEQPISVLVLYAAIGLRSLGEHALPVADALDASDLPGARTAMARIVSRDCGTLSAERVAAAATESVLENGNDAVFGALFWFVLAGAPGALVYRLANTLDAMWGYRTPRYVRFGRVAARIDDILNYVPARLTACTYALCGRTRSAGRCWHTQARSWESPNAGPVMAAGAGALGVKLGGPAPYQGKLKQRPVLGEGRVADAGAIRRALRLVRVSVAVWISIALAAGVAWEVIRA